MVFSVSEFKTNLILVTYQVYVSINRYGVVLLCVSFFVTSLNFQVVCGVGVWYLVGGIYFLSSDKIYCKVVEKTSKRSTHTILFMHFHVYHTTFAIKYGH